MSQELAEALQAAQGGTPGHDTHKSTRVNVECHHKKVRTVSHKVLGTV